MTENHDPDKINDEESSTNPAVSLIDCVPTDTLEEGDGQETSTIRRPNRDEAFMRAGDPVKLACVIERSEDASGEYAGEIYHPVIKDLQEKLKKHLRLVAFHPCVSQTGDKFIFPQKLQLAKGQQNTWNISLAEALSTPPGQWLRLWSDRELQRYDFELVDIEPGGNLEYPDFKKDLETALSENIINDLEHPVIQRLMASKRSHNGWEAFNYDV